jgi:flagellar basal-body rod modification protein FlgD
MITNPVVAGSSTGAQAAPASASNDLGKDAFLRLLTAQLQNQDPTQPVDNQAFIAQLAQFSSLEQLQGVGSRLDSLLTATQSASQLNAATLVGKYVTYQASGIDVTSGQTPPRLSGTTATAAAVTAVIQNDLGATVRTIAVGTVPAGTFDIPWDGLDDGGKPVPTGHYSVNVSARAADGSNPNVSVSATGSVDKILFSSGGPQLVIGGTQVNLSNVSGITERKSP